MKLKPISKAILAAAAATSIMPFASQAADVNVYGLVATGLYYQKTEGADNGNVGGVEQLFQNGCCGDRQGKLRQLAPDRAVEHVEPLAFCGSHVEFLLSIQKTSRLRP